LELGYREVTDFVLRWGDRFPRELSLYRSMFKLRETVESWRKWAGFITYKGRWPGPVLRSALLLQLLTYDPTAAIVAAPTTSLPEALGGVRNWDYRYSWSRDAAFILRALETCGYDYPFLRYTQWILRLLRGTVADVGRLRVMYTVEGEEEVPERVLDHLEGYMGSRPVRIGNEAQEQFQLDVYGIMMDAILKGATSMGSLMDDEVWRITEAIADFVAASWQKPDKGIWEFRAPDQHLVHSNLMAWVAMDRALRLAKASGNTHRVEGWALVRDTIRREIEERGWDGEVGAFVQAYGSKHLDASLLLMPIEEFLPGDDPRVASTIQRIEEKLSVGPLVYRYLCDDGLPGREGAFLLTSFWLVDALALSGRLQRAVNNFEALLAMGNHVGLFPEEVEPSTGAFLGNFPQGYTHMAIIYTAGILDQQLDRLGGGIGGHGMGQGIASSPNPGIVEVHSGDRRGSEPVDGSGHMTFPSRHGP
jgi:GH15 family glucan-1,4-alpha-glucosidase